MNSVQLKIKSPSANYSDVELCCDLGETVLSVKQKIEDNFPTKPAVSGQKLVYSGKILKDCDKLGEVLRFDDEVTTYTFHLVCALPQKLSETSQQPETELRQRHTATSRTQADSYSSSSSSTGLVGESEEMAEMMREFSTQYSAAMASMVNNPSEAEMAAMQQMYNQYVSLYMQYMQSQSLQQAPLFVQHQQDQQVAGAGVDLQPQVAGEGVPAGNEAPNPGGLVMNAGAAAGQIQDGGDRQRDILDWVYVMTRVMLLFSVIYFHSSFFRLAFVAGLGFLAYFYQNRIRQPVQNIQQQQPQPQPQQQQRGGDEQEPQPAQTEEENDSEVVVEEEEEVPPSKFAVLVTFFTSLISSIIPEQPQVI